MSEARAKTWGNTLDATRKKKLVEKQRRKEKEEAELMVIDGREKAYNIKKREDSLKRAQKIFYESHDAVRSFRSKLMLTDVLAERSACNKFKKVKADIEKKRDQEYYAYMMSQLKKADAKDAAKAEERRRKTGEVMKTLDEQLSEYQEKQRQREAQRMEEAARLLRMHEEDCERARMRQVEKKERAKRMGEEFVKANKEQEKMKEAMQKIEEEKESKIAIYAAQKEDMKRKREAKDKERYDEMMRVKQRLIDQQTAYLEKMLADQGAQMDKEVAQKEQERQEKEQNKADKIEKLRRECQEMNDFRVEKRRREKEESKRLEQQMLEQLEAKLDAQDAREAKKVKDRKDEAARIEIFVKKQMREKRVRDHKADVADREYQLGVLAADEEVERHIREDAEKLIAEYRAKGRDVKALLLELNKPDRLPNVW